MCRCTIPPRHLRREGSDSSDTQHLPNTLPPPGWGRSWFHVGFTLVNWTRNQTQIHSTPSYLFGWLVEFGKYKLLFVLCLWTDDPSFCAQFSFCKVGAQQCFLRPFHITSSLVSKFTVSQVLIVVGQVTNCCREIHEHATLQRLPCCFDPEFFYLPFTQKWLLLAFKTTTTKRSSSQRNNSVCLERAGFKCQLMTLDSNCCCVGKEQIES